MKHFPSHLREPLLVDEEHRRNLFLDSALAYVKYGVGCSQTNGLYRYRSRVEALPSDSKQHLATRVIQFVTQESKPSTFNYIMSFFVESPSAYRRRANEILGYCELESKLMSVEVL